MKTLSRIYMTLVFLMLFAPIFVLVIFSFNTSGSTTEFTGLSFKWYIELFKDEIAFTALKNSLFLAVSSSLIATVIGTFAALGIDRMKSKKFKLAIKSVTNVPMMNPDIVTGVSMMLLFVALGGFFGLSESLGRTSMLIAHVTFNLPYVILSVLPKFKQMDPHLSEAALDLGCTPVQTFFKIELPAIVSGIISGLMLGFTLSLDDFVISHFVSSPDFITLPLYVYNQTAHEVKYSMYALCTLIIVAVLVLLLCVNFIDPDTFRNRKNKKQKTPSKGGR